MICDIHGEVNFGAHAGSSERLARRGTGGEAAVVGRRPRGSTRGRRKVRGSSGGAGSVAHSLGSLVEESISF